MYYTDENKLIEDFTPMVYKIANRYRWNELDYEDIVQEGFMGLIKAKRNYEPDKGAKFSTHAYNMIRWTILDFIKSQNKVKTHSLNKRNHGDGTLEMIDMLESMVSSPHEEWSAKELEEQLLFIMEDVLTGRERVVVELNLGFQNEPKTIKEIAEIMGISYEVARYTLQGAKLKLRREVGNWQ